MAHKGFVVEFIRPKSYGSKLMGNLRASGFQVQRAGHKTAYIIQYATANKLTQLMRTLRSLIDPKIGGAVLFSKQTGKAWRLSNRGNSAGRFVLI